MVVAVTPCMLNSSVQTASTAAITTGRYSGLHPAITALMAIFSTVTGAMLGGTMATMSCGARGVPASMRITRSAVGGTSGRPSLKPWSNMNSAMSSALAISIRRARIGLSSASACSLSWISGSRCFDPQPGRHSGSSAQATAAGPAFRSAAIWRSSACHSSRTNPSSFVFTSPSAPIQ